LVQLRRYDDALVRFEEALRLPRIKPTLRLYNVAIPAFAHQRGATGLLDAFKAIGGHGLKPEARTFTAAIEELVRLRDLGKAHELLLLLDTTRVDPNAHTYSALLLYYAGRGMRDETERLLEEMHRRGLSPAQDVLAALREAGLAPTQSVSSRERTRFAGLVRDILEL